MGKTKSRNNSQVDELLKEKRAINKKIQSEIKWNGYISKETWEENESIKSKLHLKGYYG